MNSSGLKEWGGGWSPQQLRNALCLQVGRPVHLAITRNRVSVVSVRFDLLGNARLRLNHSFLSAPDGVINALADYLKNRSPASWKVVTAFVSSREPDPVPVRPVAVRSQGRVFDLAAIRDRMNQLYFGGAVVCHIGWAKEGRRRRRARVRAIRYGTYNKTLNLVRINPLLDDPRIPAGFLDYIVFHEMLHAAVPSQRGGSRWIHHRGAFRILERRFPDHAGMQKLASDLVRVLG